MLSFYGRLPGEHRARALVKANDSYSTIYALQESQFDRMPLHHKGEVLAGLAESKLRLGNRQEAETYLRRIVETMPDSPYSSQAQQWLSDPDSVTDSSKLTCKSCHDPGRLANVLARQGQ